MKCQLCGSRTREFTAAATSCHRSCEDYKLRACKGCGAVRLVKPEPMGSEYYDRQYRIDIPRSDDAVMAARKIDHLIVGIASRLWDRHHMVILDLCAEDDSVADYAVFGHSVDIETFGLGFGDYRKLENIPKGRFHAVTCFVSLEHATDPFSLVSAAFSALKPGGMFVASVPDARMEALDLKPHHTWYYVGHSLATMIEREFMVVAEIRHGGYLYVVGLKKGAT